MRSIDSDDGVIEIRVSVDCSEMAEVDRILRNVLHVAREPDGRSQKKRSGTRISSPGSTLVLGVTSIENLCPPLVISTLLSLAR